MSLAFRRPGGEAAGPSGWAAGLYETRWRGGRSDWLGSTALCRIKVASHNMF